MIAGDFFMNAHQHNFIECPIIFIHYGDSSYLKYTFKSTRIFNPYCRIILLGDEHNQHYTNLGIEHFLFANYNTSQEFKLFEKVYKFIAGSTHGKSHWTKFVFQRWFHIFEFIQSQEIEQFWTFDSDNLIFTNLYTLVPRLIQYDCTEQCNGICMNGFVNGQKIVKGYLDTINSLFMDKEFLENQAREFVDNPTYAFTEMRAYDEYRNRNKLNTIKLQQVLDGETFDECICQSQGMEFLNGKKKLFFKNGSIYQKNELNQKLLKVNTINMSWTNIFLIEELFTYVVNNHLNKFPKSHFNIQYKIKFKQYILKFALKFRKFLSKK